MKRIEYVSKSIGVMLLFMCFTIVTIIEKSVSIEKEKILSFSYENVLSTTVISSQPRIIEDKKTIEENHNTKNSNHFLGTVSYYGPDCRGCSGVTASGYRVSDTIYYQDETYGTLRIVAADKSIPMGSVLKLSSNNGNTVIHAIVLDRGGAIGFGKKYVLDLLCESEKQSYQLGVMKSTSIEVLRYGY